MSNKLDKIIFVNYTRQKFGGDKMPFKIKAFREKKNLTQAELCKRADISRQTLIDLESGKEVNTTISTLQKLADALNCKVSDLFCL